MLRRSPLRRGAPLKPGRPPQRRAELKTKSAPKKRARPTGPDYSIVDAVLQRDSWSCRVCGKDLVGSRGVDWSIHHLRRRSQGGTHHQDNLISVCGHGTAGCHGRIHAHPRWARDNGFLLGREVAA